VISQLQGEIAARNLRCLEAFRLKRALRTVCIDSLQPTERILVNRWYLTHREFALRWLFKRRAEKRQALRDTDWTKNARSKPHGYS